LGTVVGFHSDGFVLIFNIVSLCLSGKRGERAMDEVGFTMDFFCGEFNHEVPGKMHFEK
jgi:hypothetical protein